MEKEQFVISAFVQRAMLYSNAVTIGKTLRTTWPTTAQATFGKTIRTTWSTTAQVTLTTKTTTQCWSRTMYLGRDCNGAERSSISVKIVFYPTSGGFSR